VGFLRQKGMVYPFPSLPFESRILKTRFMKQAFLCLVAMHLGFSLTKGQSVDAELVERNSEESTVSSEQAIGDDGSRVSILGYHVFHKTKDETPMLISTARFRKQMELIKSTGIPVITLAQFLAWRRGEGEIPPQSILITMDDGWRSVYSEAFPIMKELRLPFTIFLYKNYVGANRGGRAMSLNMIKEMLKSGLCSIGSHSVSHPFPSDVKKQVAAGAEAFEKFLRIEMEQSKVFLDEKFQTQVTTYAYPGGYHTPEMHVMADKVGYDHLFTVEPGKVRRNSSKYALPRYIVFGNNNQAFEAALSFKNGNFSPPLLPVELPHPTSPNPNDLVANRLPEISANLHKLANLDPESLVMRVAGFGKVPAIFDPTSRTIRWKVNRPLRQPVCSVTLQWKLIDQEEYENPMKWTFRIDRSANYQPK